MNEIICRCSSCNKRLRVHDPELFGKKIRCPKCAGVVSIPNAGEPSPNLEVTSEPEPIPAAKTEKPAAISAKPSAAKPPDRPAKRSRPRDEEDDRPAPRRRTSSASDKRGSKGVFLVMAGMAGLVALAFLSCGGLYAYYLVANAPFEPPASAYSQYGAATNENTVQKDEVKPNKNDTEKPTKDGSEKPPMTKEELNPKVAAQLEKLKDADAVNRADAAKALGAMEADAVPAIPALVAALDDQDADVRTASSVAIRTIAGPRISVVIDFYADWCGPCRQMKPITTKLIGEGLPLWAVDTDQNGELSSLFNIRSIPTFVVIAHGKETDRIVGTTTEQRLRNTLKELPKPNDPPLSDRIDDPSMSARWLALLLSIVDEDAWVVYQGKHVLAGHKALALPVLVQIAKGKHPDILRAGAIKGIGIAWSGQPAGPEVLALLESMLASPTESADMRGQAAVVAHDHKMKHDQIAPSLIDALKSGKQSSLRVAAATRLGELRSIEAIPTLIETANEGTTETQHATIVALGKMGAQAGAALPTLFTLYGKVEDDETRNAIRQACEQIVPSAKEASPELVKALKEGSDQQRLLALELLGLLDDPKEGEMLLAGLLESKTPALRLRAAMALQQRGQNSPAATAILLETLKDEQENHEVTNVLYQMGQRAAPALTAVVTEEKRSPRERIRAARLLTALGRETKSIRPTLENGLKSKDENVQLASAMVLAHVTPKNEAVVAPLVKGLDSTDRETHQQSLTALAATRQPAAAKAMVTLLEKLDGAGEDGDGKRRQLGYALAQCELADAELDRVLALLTKLNSRVPAAVVLGGGERKSPRVAPALLEAFQKVEEPEDRNEIGGSLAAMGKPAVAGLLKLFEDAKVKKEIRLAALRVLGQMDEAAHDARATLEKYLKDPDEEIKRRVAIALAFLQSDAEIVPLLLEALEDEELGPDAQEALASMGPRGSAAVDPLCEMLKGNDANKRAVAVRLLGSVGKDSDKIGTALLALLRTTEEANLRQSATYSLARLGNKIVPGLIAALTDSTMSRVDVIRALQQLGPRAKESSPALAKLLLDEDRKIAAQAAFALAYIDPKEKAAVPVLIEVIRGKDAALRQQALSSLGAFGPEARTAVPLLIEGLRSAEMRHSALYALQRIGPGAAEAVDALVRLLNTPEKGSAIAALGAIGPAAAPAVPRLMALLDDEQYWFSAAMALGRMGEPAKKAVPVFVKKLADEATRLQACQALGQVGKLDPDLAIEPLTKLLTDPDLGLRNTALHTLGSLQSAKAIPSLREAMKSEDKAVRRAVIESMGNLGEAGAELVPELTKLLSDKDLQVTVVYALGQIGPKAEAAVPELVKLLDDTTARYGVVWTLGQFGPKAKDALPKLRELARESNGEESDELEQSIRKIEGK